MSLAPGALDTSPTLSHVGPRPGATSPKSAPSPPLRGGRRHEAEPRPDKASRKTPACGPASPPPTPPPRSPRGSQDARPAPRRPEPAPAGVARPRTHPAVGCRPVPAAAACGAARDGGPVPHRPAASIHPRGGLHRTAAAALGTGPAATPAAAAAASLAPVQLNDVVQRHIHFVGHGGRGIGPRIEPARQHAAASLPAPPPAFRRRCPEAAPDWPLCARSWRARAHCSRRRRALLLSSQTRHGRFYTFPRGSNGRAGRLVIRWRRCEGEEWAGPELPSLGGRKARGCLGVAFCPRLVSLRCGPGCRGRAEGLLLLLFARRRRFLTSCNLAS